MHLAAVASAGPACPPTNRHAHTQQIRKKAPPRTWLLWSATGQAATAKYTDATQNGHSMATNYCVM